MNLNLASAVHLYTLTPPIPRRRRRRQAQAVSLGAKGPLGSSGDAALKPALRTLVRGLERADGGQAEALWVLYLTLFVFLPGKREDALGMAEHALE